jgi:release factor glutamine methyltransferase
MGVKIQTIKDTKIFISGELNGIYEEQEISGLTNIILRSVTGVSKLHQLFITDHSLSKLQANRIREIICDLKTGKPIQYILGETTFYDCKIKLNSATLIPRPETEELVQLIINENRGYNGDIIDFGTGSGCIAVALAVNIPGAEVTGIDISAEAINVARENALLNKVSVNFLIGDIFNFQNSSVPEAGIFVSNPPYVRNSEKILMRKNVLDFEPPTALFVSDSEPLIYYKAILSIARQNLFAGGRVYFEINEALGDSIVRLLESSGYSDIKITADINNRDRIIRGTKNG